MDSRHLIDPATLPIFDLFPPLELTLKTLPQIRLNFREFIQIVDDPEVETREYRMPGPAGAPELRVLYYRPKNAEGPLPVLFHIHGGGYVMGTPEGSDPQSKKRAKRIGCVVVSVNYRLAPETPSPGPIEDCYAALKWLYDNAAELGVDKGRIAVGGESAGGGLAAALALLARDRGEVPLVFQLLIYPMLDDRTVTNEPHPYAGEFIWTAASNRFGWTALIGGQPGGEDVSAYTAPARAESLAGLPPAFISVGAIDLFIDEDMDYARRLIRAGVPTELHVYPGAFHGFNMLPDIEVTRAFERDYMSALRRALHPAAPEQAETPEAAA